MSRPPDATRDPEGQKAQVITQEDTSGIIASLFVVNAFHIISFESWDALTSTFFDEFGSQCKEYILSKCPEKKVEETNKLKNLSKFDA